MNYSTIGLIRTAVLLLFLFVSIGLFAQDSGSEVVTGPAEPDETEIILPEMYLEIEDLSVEEIDAVIPDNDEIVLSSIEFKLPEPGDIEIPPEIFTFTDPAVGASSAESALSGNTAGFYSEGIIGAGTSLNITGDINLYSVGGPTDFRLRYFHDSYDGFAGRQAGEGFAERRELIEAEFGYAADLLRAGMSVIYDEKETGLQGFQPDYYSMTRRVPSVEASAEWTPSDMLTIKGALASELSRLQLNSMNSAGYSTYNLEPEADILFGNDGVKIGAGIDYSLNGEFAGGGTAHTLGGGLMFEASVSDIFGISANADVLWDDWQRFFFPFEVGISGIGPSIDYFLRGGYRAFRTDRSVIREISETADGPVSADSYGILPVTYGWFGEAVFGWNPGSNTALKASLDFSSYDDAPVPAESSISGLYTMNTTSSTCLSAGLDVFLNITDRLSINAGWQGQLFEQIQWYSPRHIINTEMELLSTDLSMGLAGSAELRIYDPAQTWFNNDWLPALGLEGFIRLSDGFEFTVSGQDLGAAFLETGRILWDDYLDRGASLQARIKISL